MRSAVNTKRAVVRAGPITPLRWGLVDPSKKRRMQDKAGTLYLASCERFHKLGFTQLTARSRLVGLRNASPFDIELVREWPGSLYDEWEWHSQLAKWRVRGEWYELSAERLARLLSEVDEKR